MNIPKALLAGFLATAALSGLMLAKGQMGLMPELDVISMLSAMLGGTLLMGWLAHFMIGTLVWGIGFALLYRHIPGAAPWLKGVQFGAAAWLMMMVAVMPMVGAGLFGLALGLMAPVMTLMLHLVFGAILGTVYGRPAEPRLVMA
ncbi:DUF6789 family protein [Thiocystis violacea]|uniref:DUF6789 family protein n=1 Tax=Thiocystis violacea TaxID=13725 RepID=UPI0019073478|nr:DUF6789 family protein [Thiocystis violacea]MBK1724502.1 hypothetical protein [Thiocystis violacea]